MVAMRSSSWCALMEMASLAKAKPTATLAVGGGWWVVVVVGGGGGWWWWVVVVGGGGGALEDGQGMFAGRDLMQVFASPSQAHQQRGIQTSQDPWKQILTAEAKQRRRIHGDEHRDAAAVL
eukprot:Skav210926  [mRNA]  locus=scaffold978:214730:216489:+ [translate_table: standard]